MNNTVEWMGGLLTLSSTLLGEPRSVEAWMVIVVLALIALAWNILSKNFSYLFEFYERKERKRLECIEKYTVTKDLAEPDSLKLIQELRDNYYFGAITGFHAEKAMRKAIANLYVNTSHEVQWKHVLRARPHIELDQNGEVSIKRFSWSDRVLFWYNEICGGITFLAGFGLLILFVLSDNKTITNFAWCLLGLLLSAIFGFFLMSQNWPMRAAKLIQRELDTMN